MLGSNILPDNTGECWFEPFSVLSINDRWPNGIFRFGSSNAAAPTVRHGFYGSFLIPSNYVSTPVILPLWTASLTSGDVVWDLDYRIVGGNDTTSLDQSGEDEAVTVTDTAPGAAFRLLQPSFTLTAGNFSSSADKILQFFLGRDGAAGGDTMAGSAILHDLIFRYNDA